MEEVQTIVVFGTTGFQVPMIGYLQSLGYEVVAVSNQPEDLGVELCDGFYYCSITDIENLGSLLEELENPFVMTSASEIASQSIGLLKDRMAGNYLDSETIKVLGNKFLLRSRLRKKGLTKIDYQLFLNGEYVFADFEFPGMLKAVMSSGAKAVQKVNSAEEVQEILPAISDSGVGEKDVLLETWIEGKHHGGLLIGQGDRFIFSVITEKFLRTDFKTRGHLYIPGQIEETGAIIDIISTCIEGLPRDPIILDVDWNLRNDGSIEIVELGTRLSGNGLSDLARIGGVNVYELVRAITMGESLEMQTPISQSLASVVLYTDDDLEVNDLKRPEFGMMHGFQLAFINDFDDSHEVVQGYVVCKVLNETLFREWMMSF